MSSQPRNKDAGNTGKNVNPGGWAAASWSDPAVSLGAVTTPTYPTSDHTTLTRLLTNAPAAAGLPATGVHTHTDRHTWASIDELTRIRHGHPETPAEQAAQDSDRLLAAARNDYFTKQGHGTGEEFAENAVHAEELAAIGAHLSDLDDDVDGVSPRWVDDAVLLSVLDGCANGHGPLQDGGRAKLFAMATFPSEENWDASRGLLIHANQTLWQALIRYTDYDVRSGPPTNAEGIQQGSWAELPSPAQVRQALAAVKTEHDIREALERKQWS